LARGGSISSYADNAALIRFNDTGTIDVRNGLNYGALLPYPYTAGTTYEFNVVVNVPFKTYSVDVRPAGGNYTRIATDWAFRTEQSGVADLEQLGWYSDVGSFQLRNVSVQSAVSGPPRPAGLRVTSSP